jgi:exopolysaccharide biosynthesis WecB/TagA/CpsF family protein
MLHDFAQGFQEHAHGFYLLGGEESVNSSCVSILKRDYKRLNIAGRRHGYFASEDEQAVVDDINKSGASILWVGLGKPREQEFCIKWRDALKVKWIITCGGCFNYVTGDYPRAPQWMQRLNLEWLHRMSTRPRALFYRYAITTPHALLIAVTDNGKAQ